MVVTSLALQQVKVGCEGGGGGGGGCVSDTAKYMDGLLGSIAQLPKSSAIPPFTLTSTPSAYYLHLSPSFNNLKRPAY